MAAELTVGEVAALVGVTVRTLHHWDSVDLVRPRGRTQSGYRSYSDANIARIYRVLVYQELGFSLTRIRALLDDPSTDVADQLREQRRLLTVQADRLREMTAAVDRALEAHETGAALTAQEAAEIFGREWRKDWAEEARDAWGETAQWAEFERNTAELTSSERAKLRENGEAVYAALAEAMRAGVEAGSATANALAERHREVFGQAFACTHSMHVCLGRRFVSDERFTANLDGWAEGLAVWLGGVIDANARRYGVDPATARWE